MNRRNPLRHHKHYQEGSPYAGGSSFMEKVSEAVASGMGTVGFLVSSTAIILAWILANHVVGFLGHSWHGLVNGRGFDPAPFILLNLIFSAVAFYTGALVIIAQKAQTRTDKANEQAAAKHREEVAQEQTTILRRLDQSLQANTELTQQVRDLTSRVERMTKELHGIQLKERKQTP